MLFRSLIERHADSVKSATAAADEKTYRNQLNTIKLKAFPHPYDDPEPRRTRIKLKGKTVLVVDDICTNGRSLECARAYIEAAGGKAILFSWLKTIKNPYLRMTPAPSLKPFQVNAIQEEPGSVPYAYLEGIEDAQAPAEIAALLDAFLTTRTRSAGVDEASDADNIADFEFAHTGTNACDVSDDLMAGTHGINRVAPFPSHLMDVGVTDTAEINFQENIVCAGLAAREIERFEFGFRSMSGVTAGR